MWFLITGILAFSLLLWFIARRVTAFSIEAVNAADGGKLLIQKARILSLCAVVLNIAVDFFHWRVNSTYVINWYVNALATLVALVVFGYTFLSSPKSNVLDNLVKSAYIFICGLYIYRTGINNFDPAIATEVCIVFIYSLLIFSGVRNILLFVGFIAMSSSVAVYMFPGEGEHKTIFASAVAQSLLMLFLFIFVESKKFSQIVFSDIILRNSQHLIFVSDHEGNVIYVNRYARQIFGLDGEEALGDGWWKISGLNVAQTEVHKQRIADDIRHGRSSKRQERISVKTGVREIAWRETPIMQRYMLLVGEDISEEVKQKDELEKLSLVVKSVTNGIVVTDSRHRIEWVNNSFLNLMGYTLDELVGKRPIDVFSGPQTSGSVMARIRQDGLSEDVEIMQYTKSGVAKWLLVNNSKLKDREGNVIRQVEIITDITDRKRVERKFSYILQNASDIIYTSDVRGNFDFINDTVTLVLGYLPEELLGWHFTKLICEDDRERVEQFYYDSFRKKLNDTYLEFKVLSKDGRTVWVSQMVNFIFNEKGEIEGLQAIVRDITPVKQAEFEKIRKYEQQQRYNEILTKLWLKPYAAYQSLDDFFIEQCRELSTTLNIWRVGVWFLEGDRLTRRCVYPPEGEGMPQGAVELLRDEFPVYFAAVASGQILKVNDVFTHPAVAEFNSDYEEDAEVTAMMDMPILLDGKMIGILCCEDVGGVRHWTEEEENFVKGMADFAALNLEAEKRRTVERAIKESENNFRQLNETIDDVFWLYDLVEHRILYVSPSSEKVLGISPGEFYKTDNYWVNYILDEDKPMIIKAHEVIEQSGYYELEYRIRKPNGAIHWIYEKSFGIKDEHGRYVKSSGLCSDITSRKESQALIERLSLVAEKTTNSIIITNQQEEIIWVNQAFERLTGYGFAEVLGKNPSQLLQGQETSPESRDAIREILDNFRSGHVELVNYNKEGKPYWTSLQIDPVFDKDGKCLYYISVESDITTQKLAGIALQESKEKLDAHARSLEFQDAAKGKLIQSQTVDQAIENILRFLKKEIADVCYLAMFILDEKRQNFIGKRFVDEEVESESINIKHAKSYEAVSQGQTYIERDLGGSSVISESDGYLVGIGARSYIVLPLISFNEFIGLLAISFSTIYKLTEREENNLQGLLSLLSSAIRQLMLRDKIFDHNKDLNDSLRYAQNIQASILPFNIKGSLVQETFILYLPKAHVSGDFYWIEEVGDLQFMVVGDCTGHGVPGAFLTLLANNLLQKNIVENRLVSPAAILQNIDREIYTILNRNSDRLVRDGMELGISVVNRKDRTLTFAGAGLGLTCFSGSDEPLVIRGSPIPIGDFKSEESSFSETVLQLNGGEQFFMNSDGYQDQLGGINNKRLSKKTFMNYLAEVRHMNSIGQRDALLDYLRAHQKEYSQTDDITVLGFKITP